MNLLVCLFVLWQLSCSLAQDDSHQRQDEGMPLSDDDVDDFFGGTEDFTTYVTKESPNPLDHGSNEAYNFISLLKLSNGKNPSAVWSVSRRPYSAVKKNQRHYPESLSASDLLNLAVNAKNRNVRFEKRAFDSISGASGFGGFKKRASHLPWRGTGYDGLMRRRFDSVGDIDEFGGFKKRAFDSISGASGFGGFKKRAFDSISGASGFGGFRKRAFDSISGASGFGGFKKRAFDSISGASGFEGFKKRAFDSISGASGFGGFRKRGRPGLFDERTFDSTARASDLGGLGKRSFDSIEHRSFFGGFGKRAFDSIGYMSAFGGFRKRSSPFHVDENH